MFEFECFDSQMSSFGVIYLAEQISINLQYMVTSTVKLGINSRATPLKFYWSIEVLRMLLGWVALLSIPVHSLFLTCNQSLGNH